MSCEKKKKLLQQTVARHIDDLATIIENTSKVEASNSECYLLVHDESTDVSYSAQLAIFVHGVDEDFNIIKEITGLDPLGHHKSHDLLEGVIATFELTWLDFDKFVRCNNWCLCSGRNTSRIIQFNARKGK
jgi:hypothetical protein